MSDELIITAKSPQEAVEEAVHSWEVPADDLVAEPLGEPDAAGLTRFRVLRRPIVRTLDPTAARELLRGLLAAMDIEAEIDDHIDENYLHMDIKTEDSGLLIGKQGTTLEALQLMMNLMVQKRDPDCGLRIVLNTGGYREKRGQQLLQRAEQVAQRVRQTKQEYEFPPMNPADRRIVHRALLDVEGVTTFSRGVGEDRHVVVAATDANGQPLPSRPQGGRRQARDRRGGGGRRSHQRPAQAPGLPHDEEDWAPSAPAIPSFNVLDGESLSGRLVRGEATPDEVFSKPRSEGRDRERRPGGRGSRDRDRGRGRGPGRGPGRDRGSRPTGDRGHGRGPQQQGRRGDRDRGRDRSRRPPTYRLPQDEPLWASEGRDPEFD